MRKAGSLSRGPEPQGSKSRHQQSEWEEKELVTACDVSSPLREEGLEALPWLWGGSEEGFLSPEEQERAKGHGPLGTPQQLFN
jgi:hypothetical protein